MKRFLCLLFLSLAAIFRLAAAQSDDITLPGKTSPLYTLEEPFSETVVSAADEELSIQVSSIAAERSRILVRFYVTGIPDSVRVIFAPDSGGIRPLPNPNPGDMPPAKLMYGVPPGRYQRIDLNNPESTKTEVPVKER